MYNERIKTAFIRDYTQVITTAKIVQKLFDDFEKYELEWGADLCTMDVSDLREPMTNIFGLTTSSKKRFIYFIRDYTKWCVENNIPGAHVIYPKLSDIGVDKVKAKMISSPLHLKNYLDEVFQNDERETLDIVYKGACWLEYSGLPEEDIVNIRTDDLDFRSMTIHYNGRDFPIYREACNTLHLAATLSSFVLEHPNYVTRRERVAGDLVLRGLKADFDIETARPLIGKRIKHAYKEGLVDRVITYSTIWRSGLFYRIYEQERIGIQPNLEAIAMDVKALKSGSGYKSRNAIYHSVSSLESDYENWKEAFRT